MDVKRLAKIEEIYHAALDLDVRERGELLSNLCGDDSELRTEVDSLLSFANVTSSLIDQPLNDVAAAIVAETESSSLIGTKLKQYKIISRIGAGGMGEVFLAFDTKLERNVAIKFIKSNFLKSKDQIRRFQQEAKTASSLNHPNILTIYEIGTSKSRRFIAAELIEGITLRDALKNGPLPFAQSLDIALQTATALKAAHSAGIIHRDIKPENIMLRDDDLVKILDFGLAKLTEERHGDIETRGRGEKDKVLIAESPFRLGSAPQQTNPGILMGTVAYMSPEQTRIGPIDARSDLWSLGVVLFEMFTGKQPFRGRNSSETIDLIVNQELELDKENLPDGAVKILKGLLAKTVGRRYSVADELIEDLRYCKAEIASTAESALIVSDAGSRNDTSKTGTKISQRVQVDTSTAVNAAFSGDANHEAVTQRSQRRTALLGGILAAVLIALSFFGYFFLYGNSPTSASIAVLPFKNSTNDMSLDYLSDGFSESLVASLTQFDDLKVISPNSTFKYKGNSSDSEKIGAMLGVKYLIQGNVSQNGDQLRIDAELIDATSGSRIWTRQVNRQRADLADIESEISLEVAQRLGLRQSKNFVKKSKQNPEAYESLLKGRFYNSKNSYETSKKALEYFTQAVAIDPDYAEAHAALARTYYYIGANGFEPPQEIFEKARTAAEKASSLNPNLPEVCLALGSIKQAEWDWAGAEVEYRRAVELNPSLASARFKYAHFLSVTGKHEQAIAEVKRARELDPLRPFVNSEMAYAHYFARDYQRALEQNQIGIELDPNSSGAYYGRGLTNSAQGKYLEAISDFREMIRLAGDHPGVDCYLGFALAKTGQTNEAKKILSKLKIGKKYVSPTELAILYLGLGDHENAIASLERAFNEHDSQIQYLASDPHFDALRSDRSFQNLLKRVGLN